MSKEYHRSTVRCKFGCNNVNILHKCTSEQLGQDVVKVTYFDCNKKTKCMFYLLVFLASYSKKNNNKKGKQLTESLKPSEAANESHQIMDQFIK